MTDFDPVFFPFYANLNDAQKELYKEILPHIENCDEIIDVETKISSKDAMATVKAVYADHPEYFWLENTSSTTYDADTNETHQLRFMYNDLTDNLIKCKKELAEAIEVYLRRVRNRPILEQEIIAHNMLARNIHYEHGKYDQNAYQALVHKNAVCNGYSRAFQLIMMNLNIPCYYVCGDVYTEKKDGWGLHAWNMIKLGDDFFNIDLTWDDCYDETDKTNRSLSFRYFNCTDADMASNHKRGDEFKFLPPCTSTKYSFENILGFPKEIAPMMAEGLTSLTVVREKKDLMNVVCSELRKAKRSRYDVSFPLYGDSAHENYSAWIREAIAEVFGDHIGWSTSYNNLDYGKGWYYIHMTLDIK